MEKIIKIQLHSPLIGNHVTCLVSVVSEPSFEDDRHGGNQVDDKILNFEVLDMDYDGPADRLELLDDLQAEADEFIGGSINSIRGILIEERVEA